MIDLKKTEMEIALYGHKDIHSLIVEFQGDLPTEVGAEFVMKVTGIKKTIIER